MKVLYIETVENREHREYIQSIANTVSKELRTEKVYVREENSGTKVVYVLTFMFVNNYRYSRTITRYELERCYDWHWMAHNIIEEIKRKFLTDKRLTIH